MKVIYWYCGKCETGGRVVVEADDDAAILIVAKHRRISSCCVGGSGDIEVELVIERAENQTR